MVAGDLSFFKREEAGLRFRAVWTLGDLSVWKYLLKKFEYAELAFEALTNAMTDKNIAV